MEMEKQSQGSWNREQGQGGGIRNKEAEEKTVVVGKKEARGKAGWGGLRS